MSSYFLDTRIPASEVDRPNRVCVIFWQKVTLGKSPFAEVYFAMNRIPTATLFTS